MPNGTDKDQQIAGLLESCETALKSRDFNEAINLARKILALSPDQLRARELLEDAQSKLEAELFVKENLKKAQECFQSRDFQKCVNECQKIQLLDPDNQSAVDLLNAAQEKLEAEPFIQNFINSGQSLFDSGLYSEAISQWEKVRSIDAQYPGLDALIAKARAKSAPATAQAGGLFDLSANVVQDSMSTTFELEPPAETAQEAEDYQFGFTSDKDRIADLLRQGDQLYSGRQYQKAIETWSEIFMMDANHPEALQKIEEARGAAEKVRSEVRELLEKAQVAYEAGNVAEAKDLFSKIKALDPGNSEADQYLGLLEGGEPGADSVENLVAKADAAENSGQYREAVQYVTRALSLDSENEVLIERLRNLNVAARKQEQTRALLGNARAFLAEGKVESARHALTKVLETEPDNSEAVSLMQDVNRAGVGTPAAVPAPPRKAAAPSRSFPMIPVVAVAAVILLGGGAYTYFSMFRGDGREAEKQQTPTEITKSTKKTAQATPEKPATNHQQGTTTAPGAVTPVMQEAAAKVAIEARVYFEGKRYQDAIAKADEALRLDPNNKQAASVKIQAEKTLKDIVDAENKILRDADTYYNFSEYAGAVELYERYIKLHPESEEQFRPKIIKCYYNLGVQSMKNWRCDMASDYFRQVLFIDENDQLSQNALTLARRCQRVGTTDIEIRKAVALMEMRK